MASPMVLNVSNQELPAVALITYELLKKTPQVTIKEGSTTGLDLNDGNEATKSDGAIAKQMAQIIQTPNLTGSDPLERTEVDSWLLYADVKLSTTKDASALREVLAHLEKGLGKDKQYFVGKSLTVADVALWVALRSNPSWKGLQKSSITEFPQVTKWYNRLSGQAEFRSVEDKLPSFDAVEGGKVATRDLGKFVDLPGAEQGKVVVRFPPEASGFLHVGHAKAALLNQYYKEAFNGTLIMRFDDTNPEKEKVDFEQAILQDLEMLQVKFDKLTHTSDHFELLLKYAEQMIREGTAYVDDTEPEKMKAEREERKESAGRSTSVDVNVKLWEEMKKGTEKGQQCCVRAKIDMKSDNGCMRDPTIYRCKPQEHPKTGSKYKAYPTYDFACPIVDSVEGVTHALRTTEYHDRDEQYDWFLDQLKLRKPHIYEYSRLNLMYTLLSKRKLTWFVEQKLVEGWDDPRFPTVRGILRHGMTVEGLKNFIVAQGSSRSVVMMDWDKLWAFNKKVIDPIAPRYTAVLKSDHVPVFVSKAEEKANSDVAKHPKNAEVGKKTVWFAPKILIDSVDAEVVKEGETVTFINWGNLKIKSIKKNGQGKVESIDADLELENTDFKKTTKLTWLAVTEKAPLVPTVCVEYGYLITKGNLGKDEDWKDFINKDNKKEQEMLGDPELRNVKKGDIIQLQRRGFYICDKEAVGNQPVVLLYIPDGKETSTSAEADLKAKQEVKKSEKEKASKESQQKSSKEPKKASPQQNGVAEGVSVKKFGEEGKEQKEEVKGEARGDGKKAAEGLKQVSDGPKAVVNGEKKSGDGGAGDKKEKKEKPQKDKPQKDKPQRDKQDGGDKKKAGGEGGGGDKGGGKGGEKGKTRLGIEVKKEEDLSEWYAQVITKAEMIEYYDISGCYILRPWAYSIWEEIQKWFDAGIKKMGVQNCYFPMFVSQAALEKEKDHIADFSPEVAWVTKSGNTDLAEPIAIRPTSETVMYPTFAKWIKSYRDLPLKINQWCNIVRWEFKHPQPFLRTREFLWQEGHTAFATPEEAKEEMYQILDLYAGVYEQLLAVPVIKGRKTEKEKFPGGDITTTIEAYIQGSGRAIQAATSHHLGQNFSKMFQIVFEDPTTGQPKCAYQNSWGLTTRTIGVMTMVHGDDLGLVLPPRVASIQVIIVPCGMTVSMKDDERQQLLAKAEEYKQKLVDAGIRAEKDIRDNYSPGWKFSHWEVKGVPIRLEVGPKDMASQTFVAVRRDTSAKVTGLKESEAVQKIKELLDDVHNNLFNNAKKQQQENLGIVDSDWKEFCDKLDKKMILMIPFCEDKECEEVVKKESARNQVSVEAGAPAMGAKSLCIPFDQPKQLAPGTKCLSPGCKNDAKSYTLFGRSY